MNLHGWGTMMWLKREETNHDLDGQDGQKVLDASQV